MGIRITFIKEYIDMEKVRFSQGKDDPIIGDTTEDEWTEFVKDMLGKIMKAEELDYDRCIFVSFIG